MCDADLKENSSRTQNNSTQLRAVRRAKGFLPHWTRRSKRSICTLPNSAGS